MSGMRELAKGFEHASVDPKWYAFWESTGAFRADPTSARPVFSMVLPPPNATATSNSASANARAQSSTLATDGFGAISL